MPPKTSSTNITSTPAPASVYWENYSATTVTHGESFVIAGKDSSDHYLFVARAKTDGYTVVASLTSGSKVAHIPVSGASVPTKVFDLLKITAPAEWVPAEKGAVPPRAVQAGFDHKGEAVYVSRVKVGSVKVPATLLPRTKRSFAPFKGVEYVRQSYDVLCMKPAPPPSSNAPKVHQITESKDKPVVPKPKKLSDGARHTRPKGKEVVIDPPMAPRGLDWMHKTDGEYDPNAFECSVDKSSGESLVSARAREGNEFLSGMLEKGSPYALLPYHGKTYPHSEYDVLVRTDPAVHLLWVPAALGNMPPKKYGTPLQSGANTHGQKIYVGRVTIKGAVIPGKFLPYMGRTYVAYKGREYVRKVYDVLVVSGSPAPASGSAEEKSLKLELRELYRAAVKLYDASRKTKPIAKPHQVPTPASAPASAPAPTSTPPQTQTSVPSSAASGNDGAAKRDSDTPAGTTPAAGAGADHGVGTGDDHHPEPEPKDVPDFALKLDVPNGMKWVEERDGEVPSGALSVGRAHNREVYVVRAVEDFKLLVGGIMAESPGVVPHKHRASAHEQYEVLTVSAGMRYTWVKVSATVPERAVQGGYDAKGKTYVARARVTEEGDYAAGFIDANGKAVFAWEEHEVEVDIEECEVLVELGETSSTVQDCALMVTRVAVFTVFLIACCKITKALKKRE